MDLKARNLICYVVFIIQLVSSERINNVPKQFISGMEICDTFISALGKLCDCSRRSFHIVPKNVPDDCFILDLSGNQISSIERNNFARFVQLEKLYLNSNVIQALHPHAFDGLINLTVLDLATNRLLNIPPRTFTDTRLLQILNLTDNNLRAPPPVGHLKRLQELMISKNSLKFVTNTAWNGLVTLRLLNLSSNHLSMLHGETFKGLTSLVILDLSHNNIQTLANGAFISLGRLELLKLDNNRINTVEASAFQDLHMLTSLHLEHNQLVSIPLSFQSGLRSLKNLFLQENKIIEIRNDLFKYLINLNVLNLNSNRLQIIAGRSFFHLSQLVTLNLKSNQINVLPADAFLGLRMLKVLDLRNNRLKDVGNVMQHLLNLETALLSDNMISYIPMGTFDHCVHIIEIRIDHNNLTYIPEGIGYSPTASQTLKGLSLADNPIKQITSTSFGRFSSLQLLRLSNTQLRSVPIRAFNQMPRLVELWLDGNQLTTLARGTLVPLPRLKAIHLQGNLWNCQCGLRDIWSYLDSRSISCGSTEAQPVCYSPSNLAGQTLEVALSGKECIEDESTFSMMEIDILIPITVGAIVIMFLIVAFICIAAAQKKPSVYSKVMVPPDGHTGRAVSLPSFASLNSMSSSTPLTLPPRNGSKRYHHQDSIFQEFKLQPTSLDRQGSYLSINVPLPGGEYASPYAQPCSQPKDHPSWFRSDSGSDHREDIY
ncbi:leucine-rich repeat-containing protein 15-like [Anneissia japonica]|uniref:leucine-rich repeat-containing protein 15-like n=1 Tax=Anneissia japonica TaxID=1529436 RepID=UPI0014259053|nr:leucine-rich repeat-containing protein 15-like [Anneissia japonica]